MKKLLLATFLLVFTNLLAQAQPSAPTGFGVSTLSTSGIVLNWTDNSSNETGFQIERSLSAGSGFALIATAAANATSYINTGLTSGTPYYYRIRSTNGSGSSAYTAVVTATTGLRRFLIDFGASTVLTTTTGWNNITVPTTGSVTNLVESSGAGSSLNLQIIKDPSNGYGASNTAGHNLPVLDYPVSAGSDSHYIWQTGGTYRINGLDNSKGYNIRIFGSRMSVGDSRKGVFTIGGQALALEAANNMAQTILFTNLVPVSGSITVDLTLAAGSSFSYINVLDIVETSVAPAIPTNLAATVTSSSQINLTWTDASSNETGFQIERSLTAGSGYSVVTTTAANVNSFSNTNLTPGTQYFYRIKSVNAQGSSAYTTEATATTLVTPPTAPEALIATTLSSTQINLTWTDASSNETGFQIERSLTSGSGFALVATTAPNTTNYSSINLTPATQYFYRVRAVNAGGPSSYAVEAAATTLSIPPASPSALTSAAISPTQVNLTWVDASNNETGYEIERSLTTGTGFVLVAAKPANTTSFSDSGLTEATRYFYRVRAINEAGNSPYSAESNVTTPATPPAAPSSLSASPFSSTEVVLAWTDGSSNETGFQIERSLSSGSGYAVVATTAANATTYSDINLSASVTYFYRVKAINSGGSSAFTEEASVTTLTSPPVAPTALTATASSSKQINLSWTDASSNETGFEVERSLVADSEFVLIFTASPNAIVYSDTTLNPSTRYYYRVRAINAVGISAYSPVANAPTLSLPPHSPTNLVAVTSSSGKIDLTWSSGGDETGFQIERSLTSGAGFALVTTTGAGVSTYTSTGLTPETQYFFRVRAVNSGGVSVYTSEASAVTLAIPPSAPLSLSATTTSSTQISISWTDASTNETGFEIERSLTSGGGFILITTTAANRTSYSDPDVIPATKYFYRVRAINSAGSSAFTTEASATTLPDPPLAPTALTASAFSYSQINISWNDASDNETAFQLERSTTSGTGFTIIANTASNINSYTDISLNANTQYYYRLRAVNSGGISSYTPEASAITLIAPPAAPTSLTATAISTTQINLSWNDVSNNETSFQLERSITTGNGFAVIATTTENISSFSDANLDPGTQYFYRVKSINSVAGSGYSAETSATTQSLTQPYGAIFNETSFASATRFPIIGTGITRAANKLQLTGNPTLFSSYIIHDDAANPFRYTCLENWKTRVRIKTPTALNSTSYGVGIGVQSVNTVDPYSTTMRWSWDTGANFIYLYYKSTISYQIVSTTKYVPTANTYYWVEVTRNKDAFTYTIFDGTNGTTQLFTATLTFPTFTAGNYIKAHNTGQFCIHQFGGTNNEVTNWEVSTTALKNADYIGVGDSNMHGMFASNNNQRFVANAMTTTGKSFNILAGISDRASDVVKRLPEIIALNPKAVVLSIGRNDLANSVPLATVQSNIDVIINTLQAAGITVKLAGVIASNVNVSSLQTYYNNKPNQQVNAYTATKAASGTTLNTSLGSGDNIHLNAAGHTTLSNLLQTILVPQTIPAAPDGLIASATSSSQINLVWNDNANNESGYQIERSLTAGTGFTLVTTTIPNATTYSNTGLSASTQYFYRIRATNTTGNSAYSNESTATTPSIVITPPAAPTSLTASAVSSSQVNLTWNDASNNETGFQIERSLTTGTGFVVVTTTAQNITSYADNAVSAATKYFYRLKSVNSSGSSAYTSEVTTITAAGVDPNSTRRFLIDFGSADVTTTATGWNNITSPATGSITSLVQSTGAASSLKLEIVKDPSNGYGSSNTAGSNIQVLDYPISAGSDSHYIWGAGGTYRLTGLENGKVYSLRIFGSRMSVGDSRKGVFTINGQQQSLEAANNTSQTIVFTNMVPVSGTITMDLALASGSSFAYINVLDVTESAAPSARFMSDEKVEAPNTVITDASLHAYPNPASSSVTILMKDVSEQKISIRIFDLLGREIYRRDGDVNTEHVFDVNELASGLYVVKVNAGESRFTKTFVKK